jgi:hypothetical protein
MEKSKSPQPYIPSLINADLARNVMERLNSVSEALLQESDLRGRDQYGAGSSSAEHHLMALSLQSL